MSSKTELAFAPEREYEIINGIPEEKEMAGARHGGVTARLLIELGIHVKQHKLGGLYTPDTTFQIGANERLPDISFIAKQRIPTEGEPEGLWPLAPDLAVEVVSPNDYYDKVQSKMRAYFAAGVREVWVVAPEFQTVTIYHSPTRTTILSEDDELTSELLPGFRCPLRDIFQLP